MSCELLNNPNIRTDRSGDVIALYDQENTKSGPHRWGEASFAASQLISAYCFICEHYQKNCMPSAGSINMTRLTVMPSVTAVNHPNA